MGIKTTITPTDNSGKIYITDKGTAIIIDCGEDISSAVTFKILYKDPDGTEGEWIADDYNSNYVRYVNISEWGKAGIWKFQVFVEYNTGYHFYSKTHEEEIFPEFG